ncbi:hypothetical protein BTA51_08485 [Hahella sp. CCB-MM4]|uniref:translocation/assembly module TamB domain-containing protein n=1 Tax=Hahella sp. (strain CCB-MM4) TaxID=1926491 RepID=UPI000B9BFE33|nr:translocation/assembly module TamB domain-containing protein [Hahella sp. CCB-MM4]OZG73828.1 hypothetical protein BTA51_08485 [Hahella sp. CCB-MM4]
MAEQEVKNRSAEGLPETGTENQPDVDKRSGKPAGKRRLSSVPVKVGRIWLLSLAHLSAGLMTLCLALVAAVAMVLGSEGGRLWLVTKVVPAVLEGTEYQLQTENPASPGLGHWTFEHVVFSIDQVSVFEARDLELVFRWRKLFDNTIDVVRLSSSSIGVTVPEGDEEESQPQEAEPIKDLSVAGLPAIRIQALEIDELKVNAAAQEIPGLSIQGQLMAFWGENWLDSSIKVHTLTELPADISLNGQLSSATNGSVKLSLSEPAGGWIGQQMKLPIREPLDIQLEMNASRRENHWVDVDLKTLRIPWQSHLLESDGQFSLDTESREVNLTRLVLTLDGAPQQVSGTLTEEQADLNLKLDNLPLSLVEPWVNDLKGGQLSGTVALKGAWTELQGEGSLSGQTQYAGYPLNVAVNGMGSAQRIHVDSADASLGALKVQARGDVDLVKGTLDLKVQRFDGDLSYLSLLDVTLTDDLKLELNVTDGQVKGPWEAPRYSGTLLASGSFRDRPLSVQTGFAGTIENVRLNRAQVNSLESQVMADGLIDWANSRLDLQAQAKKVPVSLLQWLDIELPSGLEALASGDGRVSGSFDAVGFTGTAGVAGNWRGAEFTVNSGLEASAASVRFSQLDTRLDLRKRPGLENTSVARVTGQGVLDVEKLAVEANTSIRDLPFAVLQLADVEYPDDLKGVVNADLDINGALPFPVVQGTLNSEGMLGGEPFTINVGGKGEQNRLDFNNTRVEWRDSVLEIAGYIAPENYDLSLNLKQFDTTYLQGFGVDLLPATVDFQAQMKGTPEQPEITGRLNAIALYTLGPKSKNNEPSRFNWIMDFDLHDERLEVRNNLFENSKKHGNLDLSLGWRPYYKRLRDNPEELLSPETPLDISIQGDVDMAWLNELVDEDIQTIRGRANLDLVASGSLEEPLLNGTVKVMDGYYENQLTQSVMDDIGMELAFRGNQFEIAKGTASDTLGGHLTATGYTRWNDGNHGKVDLKVIADGMSLLRREDMEGAVSGELAATGDLRNILLSGDIEVSPFQLLLDLIPNSDIPELDVTVRQKDVEAPTMQSEIPLPKISLDITLRVAQQGFIRGRGLDAELEGEVRISGPMEASNYKGEFSVVRGTFELFGKRFNLTNGNVIFANESIALLVEGHHVASDLEYIATLSGTLDDLDISLRTIPDLPEDEALSRLLFGKSIQNITPLQAARLASAVQTLRGEGGFDPIAATRDVLGVDTLTIDSQETENGNGVAVGIGKYVTEKVYVELERTPEPSQPWKGSIEIELTPKLNLETTTGGKSGFSGVELLWKHDY